MAFQVVIKRRAGSPPLIDLTRKTARSPAKAAPVKTKAEPPTLAEKAKERYLGPYTQVAADLPEKLRNGGERITNPLSGKAAKVIDRIVQQAGDGRPETLGLRILLAAANDEAGAGWPVGHLARAMRVSGHVAESEALKRVLFGCRAGRFREMTAVVLDILNKKLADKQPAIE